MLKQLTWKRKILVFLAIFLLLSISIIAINTNLVQGQDRADPFGLPTKVPARFQVNNNTATPENPPAETAVFMVTVYPSPTEIFIAKVTDLSPNVDDQDKFHVYVRHMDGTYEQYNIGPLLSRSDLENGKLPSYIIAGIPLLQGDEIAGYDLPVPYQRFAPGAFETLIAQQTQSVITSPSIKTSVPLATPVPYPVP